MKNFFKSIGKGIVYFFTPIIWVIGMTLGCAISVIIFIGYLFYAIFLFFTGRSLFKEFPEDEEVRLIKEGHIRTNVKEADVDEIKSTITTSMGFENYEEQSEDNVSEIRATFEPEHINEEPINEENNDENSNNFSLFRDDELETNSEKEGGFDGEID